MRFGIREICEVVLRAKATQYLGKKKFYKDEPVLYFDTLKTSSLEGASTTVYATGGRGNTRLVAWEGERTLTFTMEDALISPESFAILSGAGLIDVNQKAPIYVHQTSRVEVKQKNTIELPDKVCWNRYDPDDELYKEAADIFVMTTTNGQIDSEPCVPVEVADDHKTLTCYSHAGTIDKGEIVLVDYYVKRTGGAQLIEITADKFGGNYYLEASTLFRDESSGVDMPAEFIIPNCKVQSNFTFSMAATGDPSTFTFTMDAFPDYTKFDKTHKVLASLQVITEAVDDKDDKREPCHPFELGEVSDGLTVTYDNDGTEDNIKLTVSGNNINGVAYDVNNWGPDLPKDVYLTEMELKFPVENGKNYKMVTRSPLHQYYTSDPRIQEISPGHYQKVQEFTASGETYPITTAISNKKGEITFALYDVTSGTDVLVQQVSINNKVNFAKRCNITVVDGNNLINNRAVNEESVTDFDKVVIGDTVCFTATGAQKVEVNEKLITKDSNGVYQFTAQTVTTTITVI